MNLNELFFFKVFPCIYIQNNINTDIIKVHNKQNCYFYHSSYINEQGSEKIIEEDKRREPISFSDFFEKQFSKIKQGSNNILNFDTLFELGNKENNFNYYIDSLPLEVSNKNSKINIGMNFCKNKIEFNYHINRYKKNICRFMKINNKCKNKFCYNKHIINDYIKDESSKENIGINNIINYYYL